MIDGLDMLEGFDIVDESFLISLTIDDVMFTKARNMEKTYVNLFKFETELESKVCN